MKLSQTLLVPLGAAAAFVAGACSAPTSASTKYDCLTTRTGDTVNIQRTVFDTSALFSLDGGPANGRSGVSTCKPVPVIVEPGSNFDFAVNIVGTKAYVYPPALVSTLYIAGWQSTTANYDTLFDAPTFGYNDSTALEIAPGSVFLIQSFAFGCQRLPYQSQRYIYSKFIIDSINYTPYNAITAPNGLTVYYRMVVDPICGYTSLAPGIPPH